MANTQVGKPLPSEYRPCGFRAVMDLRVSRQTESGAGSILPTRDTLSDGTKFSLNLLRISHLISFSGIILRHTFCPLSFNDTEIRVHGENMLVLFYNIREHRAVEIVEADRKVLMTRKASASCRGFWSARRSKERMSQRIDNPQRPQNQHSNPPKRPPLPRHHSAPSPVDSGGK